MNTETRLNTLVGRYGRRLGIALFMIEKRMNVIHLASIAIFIPTYLIIIYADWLGYSFIDRLLIGMLFSALAHGFFLAFMVILNQVVAPLMKESRDEWQEYLKQTARKEKD